MAYPFPPYTAPGMGPPYTHHYGPSYYPPTTPYTTPPPPFMGRQALQGQVSAVDHDLERVRVMVNRITADMRICEEKNARARHLMAVGSYAEASRLLQEIRQMTRHWLTRSPQDTPFF